VGRDIHLIFVLNLKAIKMELVVAEKLAKKFNVETW
jgi:hypothetical protein